LDAGDEAARLRVALELGVDRLHRSSQRRDVGRGGGDEAQLPSAAGISVSVRSAPTIAFVSAVLSSATACLRMRAGLD
jgi:hypothetical protein